MLCIFLLAQILYSCCYLERCGNKIRCVNGILWLVLLATLALSFSAFFIGLMSPCSCKDDLPFLEAMSLEPAYNSTTQYLIPGCAKTTSNFLIYFSIYFYAAAFSVILFIFNHVCSDGAIDITPFTTTKKPKMVKVD